MKTFIAMTLLTLSLQAFSATKTYQVTGPVLEMTDSTITVQKGKEKWEIAKDAASTVKGELKVGSKVTVEYFMTAKSIEVKPDSKAKK
jgi:RNase P/RNase MRP subunit p29